MKKILFFAILMATLPLSAQDRTKWVLVQSTLTYHMSHPMHDVNGVSHAAKGEGICEAGQCNFLIAVPAKSFTSGDSNRDLHMIDAVRGAQYPMVIVRAQFPSAETDSPTVYADLQVQFAGQTAAYKHIAFHGTEEKDRIRITGTIPATCSDFKIQRPSFLTVPIKNDIPISVDMTWRQGS